MGKLNKVIVCGQAATGKTALIQQMIYGNYSLSSPGFSTIEDVYVASVTVDVQKGLKECVHFVDTAGLDPASPSLPKHYISMADGFILVYDVTNKASFDSMDRIKRDIDKNKDKREVVIVSLGTKCDMKDAKQVDFHTANKWAQKEKVRLWEVSAVNRLSLVDPFVWISTKISQPQSKSTLTSLISSNKRAKFEQ